jgi:hypothetical protein
LIKLFPNFIDKLMEKIHMNIGGGLVIPPPGIGDHMVLATQGLCLPSLHIYFGQRGDSIDTRRNCRWYGSNQ